MTSDAGRAAASLTAVGRLDARPPAGFPPRRDDLGAFRVSLFNETSGARCVEEVDLTATFNATCSPGVTVAFRDLYDPGRPELNGGDVFRLAGVRGSSRYTLNLIWRATGGIVAQGTVPE